MYTEEEMYLNTDEGIDKTKLDSFIEVFHLLRFSVNLFLNLFRVFLKKVKLREMWRG